MNLILKYIRDESGATAIEYGLVAALIGVAIIAGATSVRDEINFMFADTNSKLVQALTD